MSLKDLIEHDLDNVWFDENEIADVHTINGKKMVCLVNSDRQTRASGKPRAAEGISTDSLYILVHEKAFAITPRPGEPLTLDKLRYDIRSVDVEAGMLIIEINRSKDGRIQRRV